MPARPKEETEFDEMLSMLDPEDMDELAGSYTWDVSYRGPGIPPEKMKKVMFSFPIIECPILVSVGSFESDYNVVTTM